MKEDFEDRKQAEIEYIGNWLKKNPKWKQNNIDMLPDLTKPDGNYQDIKIINSNRESYNLVVQRYGFICGEIENWKAMGILNKCEFKFICPDNKIYIIDCKEYLDNVFKVYNRRKPTKEYSGKEFYMLNPNSLEWEQIDIEQFDSKIYNVFEPKKDVDGGNGWKKMKRKKIIIWMLLLPVIETRL